MCACHSPRYRNFPTQDSSRQNSFSGSEASARQREKAAVATGTSTQNTAAAIVSAAQATAEVKLVFDCVVNCKYDHFRRKRMNSSPTMAPVVALTREYHQRAVATPLLCNWRPISPILLSIHKRSSSRHSHRRLKPASNLHDKRWRIAKAPRICSQSHPVAHVDK